MAHDFTLVPSDAVAVTPSDTARIHLVGLYIGTGGDIAVVPAREGAVAVTLAAVPAGSIIPLAIRQVLSTGTTASGIVGLKT